MITLTDNAKNYLKDMVDTQGKKYAHLSVKGGGCAGFEYKWDAVDNTEEGTLIDEVLVLDKMAEMFVLGCTVDYIKEFGGSYLTVKNPKAHSSCGCGTSFSIGDLTN
jgi:iron-sulfur cluster insertion protein|tara:strand:+ start:119 stop:439 length:321 start_codon:yes stop_codon:yes gene_type:complete